jgi:multidrug efflux pump subunit AcrB
MTAQQSPIQNFPPSNSVQTSNLAIASLISGILSWIIIPVLGATVAVVTGHRARREIRESMGTITGAGMATAGLVLGYIQLVIVVGTICVIAVLFLLGPVIGEVFSNISNSI